MGADLSRPAPPRASSGSFDSDDEEPELQKAIPWCTRSNTAIVFDWDDTLLCTSALRLAGGRPNREYLLKLEQAATRVLQTAMTLGETIIVTNGIASWVQNSAAQYLPGLLPLLKDLTVVSARALYEDTYPNDPFAWKRAAFELLLTKERQWPADLGLNLVSIGDQQPELDAAHHVSRLLGGPSIVKTVKFKEAPSTPELLGELDRADRALRRIVQSEVSEICNLVRRDPVLLPQQPPPSFAQHVSTASGWACKAKNKQHLRGCLGPSASLEAMWDLIN